jgi:hypothetical protein
LLIFWPCHPNSQFHALQAKIQAISLSSQDHKYLKMLHKPLPIVCTAWFCLPSNNVFMLCYSYCYRLNGETVCCWEKWKSLNFKKASDTHAFHPFYYMHYCFFSSVHDRLDLKSEVLQC